MKGKFLKGGVAAAIITTTAAAWAASDQSAPGSATRADTTQGERSAAPARPAERSDPESRSVGTTIDDATITAQVKAALVADKLTKARNINVDTMRSAVTLEGSVASQAEADRAVQIAESTQGVKSVRSKLTVVR